MFCFFVCLCLPQIAVAIRLLLPIDGQGDKPLRGTGAIAGCSGRGAIAGHFAGREWTWCHCGATVGRVTPKLGG